MQLKKKVSDEALTNEKHKVKSYGPYNYRWILIKAQLENKTKFDFYDVIKSGP